jgi:serine/threonine protein kinase
LDHTFYSGPSVLEALQSRLFIFNQSRVKLAEHKVTGDRLAVKLIKTSRLEPAYLKMFSDEAEVMSALDHVNVIGIKDYDMAGKYKSETGEQKEVVYFALELADGGELFDMV